MRIVLIVCGVLWALAAGYEVLLAGPQLGGFFERIQAQPLPEKIAWFVMLLAPVTLVALSAWQTVKLAQERQTNDSLQARLRGVRDAVNEIELSQKDADSAAQYLARTDPEDAIRSLQHRLSKTEEAAHLQRSRNEAVDLLERIESLRTRQQAFRETLGDVVGKRQIIDQTFTELRRHQDDVERMLGDLEGDGASLQDRLQELASSLDGTHPRFDEIERSMEALIHLKRGVVTLQARLAPLEQNEHGGVKNLIKAVHELRDQLVAKVDRLDRDGESNLAIRVATLAESKQQLEGRVTGLLDEFSKLYSIHKDISGLLASLGQKLNASTI
jgi:chromosome segregation ATPase